jgi:hypothetical protein
VERGSLGRTWHGSRAVVRASPVTYILNVTSTTSTRNACQTETFISRPSACRKALNNTCHPMQPCLKHITRFRNAASAHQKCLHKAYSIVAPAASERVIVPCKGNGSISLE